MSSLRLPNNDDYALTPHNSESTSVQLTKPVILLILDGVGHREEGEDNAFLHAQTPYLDDLKKRFAYGTIDASERMVGLPRGQFGNSEVGHLNIGAGRIVEQDITKIDVAIETEQLAKNPALIDTFKQAQGHQLHLLGLFSDGGVHSHIDHFFATLDAAVAFGLTRIVVHPFLDGRDTPPQSAQPYLARLEAYCQAHPQVTIGSVVGRFFAMDRDNRWERVQEAYNGLMGQAPFQANSATQALADAYARGENDEFVQATLINPEARIQNNDTVLFLNFRADRARELTAALTKPDFDGFPTAGVTLKHFASITSYGDQYPNPVLFAPSTINNGLGEYLAAQGLTQLRIAETEKYPHVTYFFSGGREQPYPGEERILVPSPKVKTYDMQPEMNAQQVTDHIVDAIEHHRFDVIICNYANGDMVGHTGDMAATIKAVETLDSCVHQVVTAAQKVGGEVLVSADHGNCENMFDHQHEQVHTQHTTNPVPFLYVGRDASITPGGALKDIAPTLLAMLGLPKPAEMTGESLINFK